MTSYQTIRTSFLRHRPHHPSVQTVTRAFPSTTLVRCSPSFLDLQARSVSRENGHFSKLSGVNYIEHSPSLQLLRSERDLAERGEQAGKEESTGILLTKRSRSNRDAALLAEYKAQVDALRAQVLAKERMWRERYDSERRNWEDVEERSLRLRLMFGVSLLFMGLLAADGIALADDVEEHCPGCFAGNTKKQLFVVGYLKSATEGFAKWWHGEQTSWLVKKNTPVSQKHAHQQSVIMTPKDKQAMQDSMPAGWEQMWTPDRRAYYANHLEKYTTWDDPRKEQKSAHVESLSNLSPPVTDSTSFWKRLMWVGSRGT